MFVVRCSTYSDFALCVHNSTLHIQFHCGYIFLKSQVHPTKSKMLPTLFSFNFLHLLL